MVGTIPARIHVPSQRADDEQDQDGAHGQGDPPDDALLERFPGEAVEQAR